jgi:hypothetical protein
MNSALVKITPDLAVLFAVGLLAAGIVSAGERTRSRPWAGYALAATVPVIALMVVKGSTWSARDGVLRPSVRRCVRAPLPAAPRVVCAATGDVGPAVAAAASRSGRRRQALAGR